MELGILTSIEKRHRYFAARLHAACDVVAVAYEDVGYSPDSINDTGLTPEEQRIVANHFGERARQEEIFFRARSDFIEPDGVCAVRHLSTGELNTSHTLRFLESAGADTVAVYGTNLIKEPLLGRWAGQMINMHLGLSPYYRGTATNFYPLLNDEPEYVGATIHLIDASIDGGPILRHARPEIVADDGPHTIGCKAIVAGIDVLLAVLRDLERGGVEAVPQWDVPRRRLYLRKDYHPRQVIELYHKLEAGLIAEYVKRARQAATQVRLVE